MPTENRNSAARTRVAVAWALIPLAFVVGFIIYAVNRTNASPLLLVIIALAGAAVPFTMMVFTSSSR